MSDQKQANHKEDRELVTIAGAAALIMQYPSIVAPCRVSLHGALGMVLAEDCRASFDLPPHDHAAMDGYAFRAADASHGRLRVCGFLPAGSSMQLEVPQGEAVRIMTGAPVPLACDTVVPFENLIVDQTGIRFTRPFQQGDNIRRRGEDVRQGELLLAAGTVLRPQEIALLAAANIVAPTVYKRLKVAILATGDELLEPGAMLQPGKIINSNSTMLAALVQEAGAEPLLMGVAADTLADTAAKIAASCAADVVLVTGGASAGDHDFVSAAIQQLGGTIFFSGVQIKPGKPFGMGMAQDRPVFIMPGNPVAVMIIFELFVRPFLLSGMGRQKIYRPRIQAKLTGAVRNKGGRPHFVGVQLDRGCDGWDATITGSQSSGRIGSLTQAAGLAELEPESNCQPGDRVAVLVLDATVAMEELHG